MNKPPVHASLFSGIGGFDLAAEWLGFRNAFHCEINEFCNIILNYHFPDAEHYTDITKTDFSKWRGQIDILTAGFPCQPFSVAGQRKGTKDNRYLWPEVIRTVREIRPAWVVGENVAGILTMVQSGKEAEMDCSTSLFGESCADKEVRCRYVVETICKDLEREGYTVRAFVIPACAVGAPHRRDRVWFVAHHTDAGSETMQFTGQNEIHAVKPSSHTESAGLSPRPERQGQEQPRRRNERMGIPPNWQNFPTQSPVCGRDDGLPFDVDRLTVPFPRWRQESIKAHGNAIVPQVAYEIFKAIQETINK